MDTPNERLNAYKAWALKRFGSGTVHQYHYWGRRVVRELGDLTPDTLAAFYSENPTTVIRAAMKSIAEYLQLEIKLPRYRIRKPLRQPRYFDSVSASLVIEKYPKRYLPALRLMHECGLRVSEAARLRVEDLKLDEKRILVHGKGNKEYSVYPSNDIIWLLQKHYHSLPPARKHGYFFPSPKKAGAHITTQTLRWSFKGFLKATPHKFRHTFAIGLLRSGANLPTIQRALGHSHIGTTSLYTTVADADVREATSRLWKEKDRNPSDAPPALQQPSTENDANKQEVSRGTA